MKYEILKVGRGYILLIDHADGTRNDYRFKTKAELNRWLKLAGICLANGMGLFHYIREDPPSPSRVRQFVQRVGACRGNICSRVPDQIEPARQRGAD